MATEVETKVLDIDAAAIVRRLEELGAAKVMDTRLTVDWYRLAHVKDGEDPWYLRIRSHSDGSAEITWKALSTIIGVARQHRELNVPIPDAATFGELFEAIDLVPYAHQEKDRQSFTLNDWRFDLDQYPGMPPYLEIEAPTEPSIREALTKLDMDNHRTSSEGEKKLIEQTYGLNWLDMRF